MNEIDLETISRQLEEVIRLLNLIIDSLDELKKK